MRNIEPQLLFTPDGASGGDDPDSNPHPTPDKPPLEASRSTLSAPAPPEPMPEDDATEADTPEVK